MTETTLHLREPAMSFSGQPPPSSSNTGSMKSGSQYAMAALGLGLVVLGVVMAMWNRVLLSPARNSSRTRLGSSGSSWSMALVLLCTGMAFLLLSLLLSIQKRQRTRGEQRSNEGMHLEPGQDGERQTVGAECYAVPSYEEVVGSDQYPLRQLSAQNDSTTDLPAYEELMEADRAVETTDIVYMQPMHTQQGADNSYLLPRPSCRNGRPGLKLLPLRERRIKSDIDGTISSSSPNIAVSNIEPITPPPQYEDNPPELPHDTLTRCTPTLK
ncbi:hypothetical protein P4O66_022877 [Electrophorus voltai]|uniref:Transmembrane protein 51b n=1 Tax=Electrophorus voltai TaxID=2609070 RepID=A0AAD8ZL68_9TELE|nr:hypothetical protein P4O66_022877 [Electrophorus voltai]